MFHNDENLCFCPNPAHHTKDTAHPLQFVGIRDNKLHPGGASAVCQDLSVWRVYFLFVIVQII